MMTDDDIFAIGTMLEEKGLSHSEIDAFFEHHGVKGQRWGIRRRNRIERTVKVGKGRGTVLDKARVYSYANPVDVIRERSFRKGSARKGRRMVSREARMANGKGKARDVLISIGTSRASDILPSVSSKARTRDQKRNVARISSGAAFALAIPMATMFAAQYLGSNAAKKYAT